MDHENQTHHAEQPNGPRADPAPPLRERAEAAFRANRSKAQEQIEPPSPEATRQALDDLQVHQIEMELQNDELQRALAELDNSRARFFDFYDMAPVGYCTVTESGLILQANLTTAALLGIARDRLLQRKITNFIVAHDQDLYYLMRQRSIASDERQSCELQLIRQDSTPLWAHIDILTIPGEDKVPFLRMVLIDITQRKQAEQVLHDSEERFRAVFENASEGIILLTSHGDIIAMNQAFADLHGHTVDEMRSLSLRDLDTPKSAPAALERIERLMAGEQLTFEVEHYCRGGQTIALEVSASTISLNSQRYIVAFHRDISERKQMETHLRAANLEAQKANQAKSRFLAAASHDLRQPLSALTLYVDVLKGRLAPEHDGLIAKIKGCCDGMTELLTDLLDISKLDAGVVIPTRSSFSVHDLLSSLISRYAPEAAIKGLRLQLHRCGDMVARTDQQLISRIVGNLIDNAVRHTLQGGILVACRRHAGMTWIEVWDTGVGIPADKTQLVFEEFVQLGQVASGKGSGLGLAIVAKSAALLGLRIRLRSRPGRGSMFAIELPLGHATQLANPVPQQAAPRPIRIGLVEDNAQVREALVEALAAAGHEVIAATNGAELIELLQLRAPDIVISDYRLRPQENGYQVIKALRAVFGGTLPALIITGDTDPGLVRSMDKQGIAIQYKPLKMDSLQAVISQAAKRTSA